MKAHADFYATAGWVGCRRFRNRPLDSPAIVKQPESSHGLVCSRIRSQAATDFIDRLPCPSELYLSLSLFAGGNASDCDQFPLCHAKEITFMQLARGCLAPRYPFATELSHFDGRNQLGPADRDEPQFLQYLVLFHLAWLENRPRTNHDLDLAIAFRKKGSTPKNLRSTITRKVPGSRTRNK